MGEGHAFPSLLRTLHRPLRRTFVPSPTTMRSAIMRMGKGENGRLGLILRVEDSPSWTKTEKNRVRRLRARAGKDHDYAT